MENTIIEIALGLLGLVIHILMKLQERKTKHRDGFSASFWIKDNWIEIAMSILSLATILLMKEELFEFLGIIPVEDSDRFIKLTAFMSGFFNTELFRKLKKRITPTE